MATDIKKSLTFSDHRGGDTNNDDNDDDDEDENDINNLSHLASLNLADRRQKVALNTRPSWSSYLELFFF